MLNNTEHRKKIRCAIYTRKSSEEGLDQEFNSLDAQYEACSAYISSQKHEGWKLVKRRYDDGGITGGTMARAGLIALLADIDAGHIDMIVIYKIDRLTRSLSDFSKIVDKLDAKGASFVSVTQSFNTATSMGRLTLNMLLSFAQFEREVTGERIRDKIAASKAKGMWMGGALPLGYDTNPDKTIRGLIVNESEAQNVRRLFELYLQHGNLNSVVKEASAENIYAKQRPSKSGDPQSPAHISRGALHHILTNPIYIGKIKHKDQIYEGQHEAIIGQTLWDDVQEQLKSGNGNHKQKENSENDTAWLKGKLFDEDARPLTPSHTKKGARRFRYYISHRLMHGIKDPSAWRLPAPLMESTIRDLCVKHLTELTQSSRAFAIDDIAAFQSLQNRLQNLTLCIKAQTPEANPTLASFIHKITLFKHELHIEISAVALANHLHIQTNQIDPGTLLIKQSITLKKRGIESKLIIGDERPHVDEKLKAALAQAHLWLDQIKAGKRMCELAKEEHISEALIRQKLKLAFLSPSIQKAILLDNLKNDISLRNLLREPLPIDWKDQEAKFFIEKSA